MAFSSFARPKSIGRVGSKAALGLLLSSLCTVGAARAAVRHRLSGAGATTRHDSYTRFVILSNARSGTNLLTLTLNRHPQIVCHSEIFCRSWPFEQPYRRIPSRWVMAMRDALPDAFLERLVFHSMPREVRAVGFKIFSHQALDPQFESTFQAFVADPDTRLVRLCRQNKLAVMLSLERTRRTDQWILHTATPKAVAPSEPVCLSLTGCEEIFEHLTRRDEVMDAFCRGRDHLRLDYEDLQRDLEGSLQRVQRHLGVEECPLPAATRRQRTGHLSDHIVNYAELKDHFANTRWSHFFDPATDAIA